MKKPKKKKSLNENSKRPVGRPTKKTPPIEEKIIECLKLGMTEKELCEIVGITNATLTNWKKKFPEFLATLKLEKLKADGAVEGALLKSAKGYDHQDKHYPANPTSMIFWLKNRQSARWRDKVEHEQSFKDELVLKLADGKVVKHPF